MLLCICAGVQTAWNEDLKDSAAEAGDSFLEEHDDRCTVDEHAAEAAPTVAQVCITDILHPVAISVEG